MIKKTIKPEKKDIKLKIVDIVMFVIVVTLVITTLVNVDKFFFKRPDFDQVYYETPYLKYYPMDENCDYLQEPQATIISDCQKDRGDIIYKKDCQVDCDFRNKTNQEVLKNYNRKISWFRMILSLVVSIVVLYLPFKQKDKLIYYAIITGSLITLVFTTIVSYNYIDTNLFSLITIVELLVVWLIYKKITKDQ